MNRYNIRKIFVWPAFKFGAIIGAVLLIFPGILGGIATRSAVGALYALVQAMGGLAMLGGPDTSDLLKLLQTLDNMGPLVVLWTTLFTVIVGGLLCGVMAAVAALIYNLVAAMGGGLEVGAEAVAAAPVPQVVPAQQPAPQVGSTAAAPQIAPAPQYQPAPVVQAAVVAQVAAPGQPPVASLSRRRCRRRRSSSRRAPGWPSARTRRNAGPSAPTAPVWAARQAMRSSYRGWRRSTPKSAWITGSTCSTTWPPARPGSTGVRWRDGTCSRKVSRSASAGRIWFSTPAK